MDVESTIRRSTWRRTPFGHRVIMDNPPYISMSDGVDENRDALRRQAFAQLAGLGS